MSADLEPAVPAHLARPRTTPTRRGEGFTPHYPSFSTRSAAGTTRVVMAYFGLQPPDDTPLSSSA